MNPLGKHFGLMTAGDLICLDVRSGKVVGGNKVHLVDLTLSIEFLIKLNRKQQPTQQASGSIPRSTKRDPMSTLYAMLIPTRVERGQSSPRDWIC